MKRALLEMMGVEDGEREIEPELDEGYSLRKTKTDTETGWDQDAAAYNDENAQFLSDASKFDRAAIERDLKKGLAKFRLKDLKFKPGKESIEIEGLCDERTAEKVAKWLNSKYVVDNLSWFPRMNYVKLGDYGPFMKAEIFAELDY